MFIKKEMKNSDRRRFTERHCARHRGDPERGQHLPGRLRSDGEASAWRHQASA